MTGPVRRRAFRTNPRDTRHNGQALVEFAFAGSLFLLLMMVIFDLGLGVYQYNGVSQAAREIARTTSVYPGATLGESSQVQATIKTQQNIIPGLGAPTFECVDITGTAVSGGCNSDDFARVTISAPYTPTPLVGAALGLVGIHTIDLRSSSTTKLQ